MEIQWIFFIIGLFIGMAIGVLGMALLAMASLQTDEKSKERR